MKFSYEILPEKRLICLRYEGAFTLKELLMGTELLWSDQRYHPDYQGIVDLTDSTVGVGWADFRAFVEFLCREDRTSRSRWAAVAGTPLAAACALLYKQACTAPHSLDVFSTWDAACNFLKVELSPDQPLPCYLA